MKTLVILPSYNEKENICQLIGSVLDLGDEYYVCVVDDNSPDHTADVIREYKIGLSDNDRERLNLIVRSKKDGRGGAVRTGLEWGLHHSGIKFDSFVEMDCDFSHPPSDIPRGVQLLGTNEVALGSRYPSGKIVGWPLKRRALSFCANLLARILISWSICDYTNGFRFYTRQAAEFLCGIPQRHKGYIYLSETLAHFMRAKFRITSFPIVFVNRERGVSNTSFKEVFSALRGIFEIAWKFRTHG